MHSETSNWPARLSFQRGGWPDGDAIFVSTDEHGTRGELNARILERLGLSELPLPSANELSPGYAIVLAAGQTLCFIVTVEGRRAADVALTENLAACLADLRLVDSRSFWLPLMGTGAGRLTFEQSLKCTLHALLDSEVAYRTDAVITISVPETVDVDQIASLHGILAQFTGGERSAADDRARGDAILDNETSAALAVAAKLEVGRSQDSVTTTLFMFALAESDNLLAPPVLRASRAARAFAAAVKQTAAPGGYSAAWREYFGDGFRFPEVTTVDLMGPTPPPLSSNMADVLARASAIAGPDHVATIADVVIILLGLDRGRYRRALHTMQIVPSVLAFEFQRRFKRLRADAAADIRKTFLNDRPTDIDGLHYDRFAKAISAFLRDDDTTGPLSVSIQAPWGAGKSSLMRLIRKELDPDAAEVERFATAGSAEQLPSHAPLWRRVVSVLNASLARLRHKRRRETAEPRTTTLRRVLAFLDGRDRAGEKRFAEPQEDKRWTIWFNAWKYESSEQVWAGLVDAIVTQVSDRLGWIDPIEREMFLLRLNLARIDDGIVRRRIYERVLIFWWGAFKFWLLAALVALASSVAAFGSLGSLAFVAQLAGFLTLVGTFAAARKKVESEPARFSLAEYMRVPDYTKSVGVLHEIHHDLQHVLRVVPTHGSAAKPRPLVIFIDDLDRCSPGKVASVVEGINMFLASDLYECMFVIGMDPQMVAAALEQAHKDVREQLPSYEHRVPLGWRFMDKFVQLPFTIPPCESSSVERFIMNLLGRKAEADRDDVVEPQSEAVSGVNGSVDSGEGTARDEPVRAGDGSRSGPSAVSGVDADVTAKPRIESEEVQELTLRISSGLSANPREIKRLLNMVRFCLYLRAERVADAKRLADDDHQIIPELDQYRRWITLSVAWPDMMRWLQWGVEQKSSTGGEATTMGAVSERLAQLERAAGEATDMQAWRENVARVFGFGEAVVSWLEDPKLLEFFREEFALEMGERLSNVVSSGFY